MRKLILIAEDYEDVREYMVILVRSFGYEVLEAVNGVEAIEAAKKYSPNLILMDVAMPIMTGLMATQIIRKLLHRISRVPIIALTAFGDCYLEKAKKAGCDHLISKPVDFKILESAIGKYCPITRDLSFNKTNRFLRL